MNSGPVINSFRLVGLLAMAILLQACSKAPTETVGQENEANKAETAQLSVAEATAIARDAYLYGLPLVLNYKTLHNYAVDKTSPEYKAAFNDIWCDARLSTPDDTSIVTPNADTPYCMVWMDLRAEPVVLSVPEMAPERYYSFQLIDLFTHNFAYVGTFDTGNGAGKYLIAGPDWNGDKPTGITDVFQSETGFIFSVARTQLFDTEDLGKVKELQNKYGLQPLSAFLGNTAPAAAPTIEFPTWVEGAQFDERSLTYLDFLLSLQEQPVEGDKSIVARMARLGLGTGNSFDFAALSPEMQEAVKAGVKEGFADIEQVLIDHGADPLGSAKIFGTRDFLHQSAQDNFNHENHYLIRATAAHIGLYGNSGFEAIYPSYLAGSDGKSLDASINRYTLTFEKGKYPPVKSFWSLTMYDGKTQLFVRNPLDRYLLNSTMLDQVKIENNGSVVFHIGKDSPGKDLESNWLPAPDGPFYMVLRLYGPESEALDGEWTPPVLQKLD
jgi:hypothetical protein